MAIVAYTGLPGHGKSYGVVDNVIVPALKSKRPVFSNIPMNDEECQKRFGMTVNHYDIQEILDNPNWFENPELDGSILIIDEAMRLWKSGLKTNNADPKHTEFLAEHRHRVGDNGMSIEIVLVTQDLSQISAFVKALVESTFRVTKLTKMGLNSRYRVDVYFGPVTGQSPPISKRDREILGKFKKSTFSLYKSHTKSDNGAGVDGNTDKRSNALGKISIKLGIGLFILCSFVTYYGLKKMASGYGYSDVEQESSVNETLQPDPVDPVDPVRFDQPKKPYKPKQPEFKFLSDAEEILIVWNNGHFPKIDYKFKVIFSKYEVTFTPKELKRLSYSFEPINECMVRIKGSDFDGSAMCPRIQRAQGWVSGLISSDTNDTPET